MHPFYGSKRDVVHSLRAFAMLAVPFVMAGCGPGSSGNGLPDTGPAGCEAGELALEDGGCQPAGVPPDGCGVGFEPDGQAGCNAILPTGPCPPGQSAIPGEIQCHDVAPCGSGDYGTIPVDATTQFVNGAYPGNDSDGTQARPWKRIQEGIDHAESGAIVAVAAGSYNEDLRIQTSPVRVWGRCPALVEVVGTGVAPAALGILSNQANGSEVHGLAMTGPSAGIVTSGAGNVVVEGAWIHDTMARGIEVNGMLGPSSITVSASLIETTQEVGVYVAGSQATIESTVVRATRPRSDGTLGRGILVQNAPGMLERSTLTLRGSLLEQNHEVGVFVAGSDATIESTVVRATQPLGDGMRGYGIAIQPDPVALGRATLMLRTSLLADNHDVGVLVSGSDATVESAVVRATQPRTDGTFGRGIGIQYDPLTHERAVLMLRTSLVEQNHEVGVVVLDSEATIESTVVRATQANSDGTAGDGIAVVSSGLPSPATITSARVEANARAGIVNMSAAVVLVSSVVRCNPINLVGEDILSGQPFTFEGSKDNVCGCETLDPTCLVLSSNLSPPPPPGNP